MSPSSLDVGHSSPHAGKSVTRRCSTPLGRPVLKVLAGASAPPRTVHAVASIPVASSWVPPIGKLKGCTTTRAPLSLPASHRHVPICLQLPRSADSVKSDSGRYEL